MTITGRDAFDNAVRTNDHRSELRKLADENWTVHQLLVLLDTGRVPADKWGDFALVILAKHNKILQDKLMAYHLTHVSPLVIPPEEIIERKVNDA